MENDLDVVIRPYEIGDAEPVYDAVRESIAELLPWMPWCYPEYSLNDSRTWLETQIPAFLEGTEFEFAITSGGGRFLGACGLNRIDKPNCGANLGYWVRSAATRRGVATAAVRILQDWAFRNTDLVRLEVVVASGNLASHRVAEKAGAVREGTARSRLLIHGTIHDATIFSFIRPESTDKAGKQIKAPVSL